ncbi:hypothetical protein [Paenibacillus pseudetheri]|uniref:Uncharacterized protein n=1 Tax=Paenibacillus pseudetheri TaxID=2897682 RepID=A0ABM9B639_9BACL|nr:hypothetical protein [Paenibacillus pseudetheri]CAH1053999.1 hypothetical protein PAECIP111894_00144 [Paenibacillus pseudetheri]
MDFRMNFNQTVKVKLTEKGMNILREQHEELERHYQERTGKDTVEPFVHKTDEEGYSSFPIWQLMKKFGPHIALGKLEPFKGTMIFLNGEPTEFSNRTESDKEFIRAFNEAHSKNSP